MSPVYHTAWLRRRRPHLRRFGTVAWPRYQHFWTFLGSLLLLQSVQTASTQHQPFYVWSHLSICLSVLYVCKCPTFESADLVHWSSEDTGHAPISRSSRNFIPPPVLQQTWRSLTATTVTASPISVIQSMTLSAGAGKLPTVNAASGVCRLQLAAVADPKWRT